MNVPSAPSIALSGNPNVKNVAHEMLGEPPAHLIERLNYASLVAVMNASMLVLTDSRASRKKHRPWAGLSSSYARRPNGRRPSRTAWQNWSAPTRTAFSMRRSVSWKTRQHMRPWRHSYCPYGDGHAAGRIAALIQERYARSSRPNLNFVSRFGGLRTKIKFPRVASKLLKSSVVCELENSNGTSRNNSLSKARPSDMNDLIQHEQASVAGRSWHPRHMLSGLWSKRDLIWAMTRREIEARYKGSLGGLFWYVFNSLALLAIYSFVFGVIFKARWQASGVDTSSNDGECCEFCAVSSGA